MKLMIICLAALILDQSSAVGSNSWNDFLNWNNIQSSINEDLFENGRRETTCECGTNKKRIVGGSTTDPHEYPFMLSLILTRTREHFCGATILSESFAITAAHCTHGRTAPITVLAGAHDIRRISSIVQESQVARVIEHEMYHTASHALYNDIAILVLRTPLRFNANVLPICMPTSPVSLDNEIAKTIGWGKLGIKQGASPTLQEIDVRIQTLRECRAFFPGFDSKSMVCSGNPRVTACMGDSGGPLFWLDPETNRYTLVGLVSFGLPGCVPGRPTVQTDVSSFLGWIKSKVHRPLCHKI